MKRALKAILILGLALDANADDALPEASTSADFAASKGAAAEAQLRQRLRESVRTIPGTDTQYLVGGYLQLDGLATRRKQDDDEQNTFFASAIPFADADHDYRLSVRQSQFNWISRTPTADGAIWTRLQANLFPLDGTTSIDLNQLFVRFADWLVVGKTYSTFMDEDALPTTLDYNGPAGATFVRQWLARGSLPLGSGWTVDASIEESQADQDVEGPAVEVAISSRRPDLAARVRYESDGGHFQVAGLTRRVSVGTTGPFGQGERPVDGYGLSISGSVALLEDDAVLFQAVTGKGVARYFNDAVSAAGLALDESGQLEKTRLSGVTLYYHHKWAPSWLSVAGASTTWASVGGRRPQEALRRGIYASANLIHLLAPTLVVGAEILWGEATRVDGADATNLRLQLSVRYLIF